MLRIKAHNNALKKHLSGLLDYTEVKFFHPPIVWEIY